MKRKIFMALAVIGCLSFVNAKTLQEEVAIETEQTALEDNFIKSAMLAKKARKVGEETLLSLRANLHFIERLENDPNFVKCVVLKENIKKLNKLAIGAKRLLDKGKASREDYRGYLSDLQVEKSQLNQQLKTKECKEK